MKTVVVADLDSSVNSDPAAAAVIFDFISLGTLTPSSLLDGDHCCSLDGGIPLPLGGNPIMCVTANGD